MKAKQKQWKQPNERQVIIGPWERRGFSPAPSDAIYSEADAWFRFESD